MEYVTYDEDGNLTGAFSQELHPSHADKHIEVTLGQRHEWLRYRANAARDGIELAVPVVPPQPTEEELIKYYDGVVQKHLDDIARDRFRYGDPNKPEVSPILHAISYADEPAVVKFQAEGRLLRAWRSLTWATAAAILNAVTDEEREIPTEPELLAELEATAPAPTAQDVEAEIIRLTTA